MYFIPFFVFCVTLFFSSDDRYKMSLLKPSTKALALSCKVSVRMDSRGFLSLQYLIRNDDGQICFVEYYCCPDVEVDNDWFTVPVRLLFKQAVKWWPVSLKKFIIRRNYCHRGSLFHECLWIPTFWIADGIIGHLVCILMQLNLYNHTNLQNPGVTYIVSCNMMFFGLMFP